LWSLLILAAILPNLGSVVSSAAPCAVAKAMTDADSIETTDVRGSCSWCEGSLRPHHYVQIVGSSVFTLCSEDCLRARLRADAATRSAKRRRNLKWLVVATSFVVACITPHSGPPSPRKVLPSTSAVADTAPLPGSFGPEWPPSEASLIADLGRDAWLHPLAGPFRRMPSRDSRVFGAERAGDRPIECRKGHCGVDLGGEIWGEQVHAAHDGVVDRVQRAANEQHGGHYVRIAHRSGTVFTQYFHLAAVPRWIQPGARVKAGDLIGLLGDTGVKESTAHLHFTVSVRPAADWAEQYIDPEPLIALWPLRIPMEDAVAVVNTAGKPGVPLGGAPVGATRRTLAKRAAPSKATASDDEKSARRHPSPTAKTDESEADRGRPAPAEEQAASESSE
jgi:murein DD-endopeptidase MepM/ murein hydrolase activator NlpD